ncbi:MAG TPA: ArsC/Spx/MgsR family protein [Pyrinomonadaceae bacterium]|nr:ArsC/Spx/MgsR family protein [Pyrinomonadaceae bacterium]
MAQLFRENNVEHERIDYFAEPLTEEKLRELLRKMNLAPFEVLRKNEAIFKESNLSPETAPDEIIKLIVAHPNLLQRPIVEIGEKAVLARPIERALVLINSAKE